MSSLVDVAVAVVALIGWHLGTRSPGPSRPRRAGAAWRPITPTIRRQGVVRRLQSSATPARWATIRDLRPLAVPRPTEGRICLGVAGGKLLAAERGQSVLVVGPTQSRKTSGFAVPAVLEWKGPVVAVSVKADLVRTTWSWRRSVGPAWVYDPTASTGLPGATWSPLDASATWPGARRTAASLTEVARASAGSLTDGDFWYATAAKLVAPLLLAAATSGRTMTDVVRWIDAQEVDEVADALVAAGEHLALQAAHASWARDDRQRSAVYTTAETVVEAFADPVVAASAVGAPSRGGIDPAALVATTGTLYLCAPAHDQRRLRPVFATLVGQVLEAAYERATRQGTPVDPPLLVVLDEAANVAPVADLDVLASTASGHGVQLVTVWQDLAQLRARYGPRASSVVNNHRVKVFLSGISDPDTLEHASALIGEAELRHQTTTVDARGTTSRTDAPVPRRLVPPDALRRVAPGKAVVLSGHLSPVEVMLRPWQDDRMLRRRAFAHGTTDAQWGG